MCLCISGNNPAERKKSIMWERKELCLQKHRPSGSERGWDQLAARQFVHCNREKYLMQNMGMKSKDTTESWKYESSRTPKI